MDRVRAGGQRRVIGGWWRVASGATLQCRTGRAVVAAIFDSLATRHYSEPLATSQPVVDLGPDSR